MKVWCRKCHIAHEGKCDVNYKVFDIGKKRRGQLRTISKMTVALKYNYICQKCGVTTTRGEVDHINPLDEGGKNTLSNLSYLCKKCHKIKTNNDREKKANS